MHNNKIVKLIPKSGVVDHTPKKQEKQPMGWLIYSMIAIPVSIVELITYYHLSTKATWNIPFIIVSHFTQMLIFGIYGFYRFIKWTRDNNNDSI